MDKQQSTPYTGRFGGNAERKSSDAPRTATQRAGDVRRPSGFGTAGSAPKAKPAPAPDTAKKVKPEKPKKEKRARREREPGKNRPVLRILLIAVAIVLIVMVLMVLIFGGEDTTYHQMPTIERESIAHFEPEQTPLPGAEGL